MNTAILSRALHAGAVFVFMLHSAGAAILSLEDFEFDPNWYARDGIMGVAWNNGTGYPAGSLHGSFADQDIPSPEFDAFRVDFSATDGSGGPWVGDYYSLYPGFTQFTFDFMAADILPSSFIIQISDGLNTFIRNLLPQLSGTGAFLPIAIPLAYDGSWLGGSAAQFSNTLGNVSFIDFQVVRNASGSQNYFLDNFALNNESLGEPEPVTAVPEARMIQMWGLAAFIILTMRRRVRRHSIRSI